VQTKTVICVNVIGAVQLCISTKNVYPRISRGTKHRVSPPLQKVGGHVPLSTHGSTPMLSCMRGDVSQDLLSAGFRQSSAVPGAGWRGNHSRSKQTKTTALRECRPPLRLIQSGSGVSF